MSKWLLFLAAWILIIGFSSCNLEKARPDKNQQLILASDCLSAKDKALFRSFTKSTGIKIIIRTYTTDSLKTLLSNEKHNSEIDVVITSSVYDMNQLDQMNLLQRISNEDFSKTIPARYASASNKFIGIGVDPYILVSLNDSLRKVRNYKDFTLKTKWCTTLQSESDWYPFYAPVVYKLHPEKAYNSIDWIKNFLGNKQGVLQEGDSSTSCNVLLTKHSTFKSDPIIQKSKFKKGEIIFPNQLSGGSYYNLMCFGIVKQAKNYSNAIEFMNYLLIEAVNNRLNQKWQTFPVISTKLSYYTYQNIRFKRFSPSTVYLTKYYDRVKNVLIFSKKSL